MPSDLARPENAATAPTSAVSVLVVELSELPGSDASVIIIRRPTGAQREIFLIGPHTTPQDFAVARRKFMALRARIGDDVPAEMRAHIVPLDRDLGFDAAELEMARRTMAQAREGVPQSVEKIGTGRGVTVLFPAQQRRPNRRP